MACTSTGGQVAQRYCSGGANNSSDHAGSAAVTAAVDVRPCGYDFGSPPSRGQVQLLIGPMFSGKSTELLRRVRRYQHARHNCLLIKSAKDGRYSQVVHCVPPPRFLTRSPPPPPFSLAGSLPKHRHRLSLTTTTKTLAFPVSVLAMPCMTAQRLPSESRQQTWLALMKVTSLAM